MATDTGGPAFPAHGESPYDDPPGGMTLLDWFAAQALVATVRHWQIFAGKNFADPSLNEPKAHWHERCAVQSYQYAQAMLAEKRRLEKGEPDA